MEKMQAPVLGILGGGQLGRMIAAAAHDINIKTIVLDPSPNCPASAVANEHIIGSFTNEAKIIELAKRCTFLTVEIEHVNVEAIAKAAASTGVTVQPSASCVGLVQDKYAQKRAMRDGKVPLGDFQDVSSPSDVSAAGQAWGYPLMLKSRMLAYDGRGNAVVKDAAGIQAAWDTLAAKGGLYVERWVPFVRELAVIVVRSHDGSCITYPTVHTVQRDSICHTVIAPATIPATVQARAGEVAAQAIRLLDGAGVFGVELFELSDGTILLNEIAPRVHNSGHFTIEGCVTSQFENHVRAVCGLPLGSTAMRTGCSVMLNILGHGSDAAASAEMRDICQRSLATPGAALHWYGKADVKAQRKMGHVTVTGARLQDIAGKVSYIAGVDLPELGAYGRVGAWSPTAQAVSSPLAGAPPLVGIIMGSDSDLPTMAPAAEILRDFGVPVEVTIVSAHRTAERMYEYARGARSRGLRAIIAGAGGAAHLPGMVASLTCLPVIGVPVPLKHLDGVDSLHSILQMPKGIPVATVAIGNAANAGLLAARILGVAHPHLLDAVEAYARKLEEEVQAKAAKLEAIGWEQYLQSKK